MVHTVTAPVDRFWAKVNKVGPVHPYVPSQGRCWVWTAATDPNGYGRFGAVGHRTVLAHRYSYLLAHGRLPQPPGDIVRHSCDNPPCVNTGHLLLGTRADNSLDAVSRGRTRGASRPGEANPSAKLSQSVVDQIRQERAKGTSLNELVRRFGMSRSQTYRIITGQSWPTTR